MPITIVHQSPHELVVVKPAGLASEHTRNPHADSLVFRLAGQGFPGLRCVHRLDGAACGLMLLARTVEAARHYSAQIESRRWHKWYVARVGVDAARAGALVGPHEAHLATEGRTAIVVEGPEGRHSRLDVVAAAPAGDDRGCADVLIELHTGRFHQIRVMLANLGAPLAGDRTYGGDTGPMYLEHVLLGARPFDVDGWAVWAAPPHADRPPWHADLQAAVETRARQLAATLGR